MYLKGQEKGCRLFASHSDLCPRFVCISVVEKRSFGRREKTSPSCPFIFRPFLPLVSRRGCERAKNGSCFHLLMLLCCVVLYVYVPFLLEQKTRRAVRRLIFHSTPTHSLLPFLCNIIPLVQFYDLNALTGPPTRRRVPGLAMRRRRFESGGEAETEKETDLPLGGEVRQRLRRQEKRWRRAGRESETGNPQLQEVRAATFMNWSPDTFHQMHRPCFYTPCYFMIPADMNHHDPSSCLRLG